MFAKIFDTRYSQVCVFKQANENGEPELRFFTEPEGLGVCSMAFEFNDNDEGWDAQAHQFSVADYNIAEEAAKQLNAFSMGVD